MRRPQSPRNPSRPRQTEARRGQPRPSGQLEPGEFADAKTPEERTQAIFELMVDGRFTWGAPAELATVWGVSPTRRLVQPRGDTLDLFAQEP